MGGILGPTPSMPDVKMPPPPPPPAPMDAPDIAEPELEMAKPDTSQEAATGSKRKYRKVGKAGPMKAHAKYKGGGLSGV